MPGSEESRFLPGAVVAGRYRISFVLICAFWISLGGRSFLKVDVLDD